MALINCPECSKEVSDKAASCPNCGYILKTATTKNLPKGIDPKPANSSSEFSVKVLKGLMIGVGIVSIIYLVTTIIDIDGHSNYRQLAEERTKAMAEKDGLSNVEITSINQVSDGVYKVYGKGLYSTPESRAQFSLSLAADDSLFKAGKQLDVREKTFVYEIDLREKPIEKHEPAAVSPSQTDPLWKKVETTKNYSTSGGPSKFKRFKVRWKKTATNMLINIDTDLPDGTPLMVSTTKTGLRGTDPWEGDDAKPVVMNGKAEVIFPLKKGSYDLSVMFNSFWLTYDDASPAIRSLIGEYGENLQTPYRGTDDRFGKTYRTIEYNKTAAF